MSKLPVRIGVSSCLLGETVRYDGGHKRNTFLVDILGPQVEWVPICPEVELGLGIPRESLHLVRMKEDIRIVFAGSGEDITDRMRQYARERVAELAAADQIYVVTNAANGTALAADKRWHIVQLQPLAP